MKNDCKNKREKSPSRMQWRIAILSASLTFGVTGCFVHLYSLEDVTSISAAAEKIYLANSSESCPLQDTKTSLWLTIVNEVLVGHFGTGRVMWDQ